MADDFDLIQKAAARRRPLPDTNTIRPGSLDALGGKTVIDEALDKLDAWGKHRFGLCGSCKFHQIMGAGASARF